eukprot:CAMPEP_0194221702 /NCGR_PEP_ID=MMETSP0156-20130528/31173_1 /TAXON_ID=33649 /ORGANISM="Thalassionema nitzschioides, Strain L26-B" /LENGTH=1139 /DNA_ID=CAMNT_0038952197 /DNA_START=286 /DNA_END=3705 /DNA_ORIENTATION=+
MSECIFQLDKAVRNHDLKISRTDFAIAINSVSNLGHRNKDFSSYESLPENFKEVFSHSACICEDKNYLEKSCCNVRHMNISDRSMEKELCVQIELALKGAPSIYPQRLLNFSQDAQVPVPIIIETGFVIANSVGIEASDMVSELGAYDDLRFSFDILAEEVVKYINGSSVEFLIESTSLEEIYDMHCPDGVADLFCQSVFATFTVHLLDSTQNISFVQETYRKYMQAFVDLGLLNDSLRLSISPDLPIIHILNGTMPLRPTISPSLPQVESAIPTIQPIQTGVVSNQFIIRNDLGLTSVAFGDTDYQELEQSYKSFLMTFYENITLVTHASGALDDILDVDCSDGDEFLLFEGATCQLVTANHTVELVKPTEDIELILNIFEEVSSGAITKGFLQMALNAQNSESLISVGGIQGTTIGRNIATIENTFVIANDKEISSPVLEENNPLFVTLKFVYNAMASMIVRDSNEVDVLYNPFSSFIRLENVGCPENLPDPWLCQKVDASYEVKVLNLFLDQSGLQQDLFASTESAITSGYLQKLLNIFEINRTLFVANDDVNIFSTAPTSAQMPTSSSPILRLTNITISTPYIVSARFQLSPEDLSVMNPLKTNLTVALTNVAKSVISLANLAGTVIGPSISSVSYIQDSYEVGRISETPCPGDAAANDQICYLVLSSYSIQIDDSEVDEEPIRQAYTTATQAAIQEGSLLEALSKVDPQFPFIRVESIDPEEFPETLPPTLSPTYNPSYHPTLAPSGSVLKFPSTAPSLPPSRHPSFNPTVSSRPSSQPSLLPSSIPSLLPSMSAKPTFIPSKSPTTSIKPSSEPSDQPSDSSAPSQRPSSLVEVAAKTSAVSVGGIVGIVFGVLLLLGLCGAGGYFGWKRYSKEKRLEKDKCEDNNTADSLHGSESKSTVHNVSKVGEDDDDDYSESESYPSYSSMEEDSDSIVEEVEMMNKTGRRDSTESSPPNDEAGNKKLSTNATNNVFSSFRSSLLSLTGKSKRNGETEETGKLTPDAGGNVGSEKSGFFPFFRSSANQDQVNGTNGDQRNSANESTHNSDSSKESFCGGSDGNGRKNKWSDRAEEVESGPTSGSNSNGKYYSETNDQPTRAAGSFKIKPASDAKDDKMYSSYDSDSSDFDSNDSYSTM